MLNKIRWYLARLGRMSFSELVYRVFDIARANIERLGFLTVANPPQPRSGDAARSAVQFIELHNTDDYMSAAERVLSGDSPLFGIEAPGPSVWKHWNRDHRSGVVAPTVFGKTLNYRDPELVGDIKYLWEPNRHLHLVILAQAYSLSSERKYLYAIVDQLDSWFDQCRYPLGPNWTSSLELGIRLINWSVVWELIGGRGGELVDAESADKLISAWLDSIYQHCHFIQGHFSRYSSANNHLIGEAAGLFVASVRWPFWPKAAEWRESSREILENEIRKQTAPDGVNREQAISYQQFVLDFFIIAGLTGRRNGYEFSDVYWERIESMMNYIASLMDVRGNVPMIGDADDGYVVRLSAEPDFCPYRSLLATGAIIFGRGDLKAKAGRLDDKTRWLLGADAPGQFNRLPNDSDRLPIQRAFPHGGYYVLGCDFETDREIRLVADAGPLGYLSIAAHGHADALAFTLSVGGEEILVDPGTYAYHTQKKWRDYFRGTSAHNTVRIDGLDQSVAGGNFMWLRHAETHVESWNQEKSYDRLVATHNGYKRLQDPVMHRREIFLDKIDRTVNVTDSLDCTYKHHVECFWHFSDSCKVTLDGALVSAQCNGRIVLLEFDSEPESIELVSGDPDRPLGWISRQYDVKNPSPSVVCRFSLSGSSTIVTNIQCH